MNLKNLNKKKLILVFFITVSFYFIYVNLNLNVDKNIPEFFKSLNINIKIKDLIKNKLLNKEYRFRLSNGYIFTFSIKKGSKLIKNNKPQKIKEISAPSRASGLKKKQRQKPKRYIRDYMRIKEREWVPQSYMNRKGCSDSRKFTNKKGNRIDDKPRFLASNKYFTSNNRVEVNNYEALNSYNKTLPLDYTYSDSESEEEDDIFVNNKILHFDNKEKIPIQWLSKANKMPIDIIDDTFDEKFEEKHAISDFNANSKLNGVPTYIF